MWKRGKLCFSILLLQTSLAILLTLFSVYDETADASAPLNSASPAFGGLNPDKNPVEMLLPSFRDSLILPLLGLGLTTTGLPSTVLSGLGMSLMTFIFASQYGLLWPDLVTSTGVLTRLSPSVLNPAKPVQARLIIGLESILRSTRFGLGVTLTTGVLHGKVSPLQCLVLALIQVPVMALLSYTLSAWQVVDGAGGLTIYLFSVYFGLGISATLWRYTKGVRRKLLRCDTERDLTALIGTIVILITFPVVACSWSVGDKKHRIIINTWLAVSSSCLSSYAISSLVDPQDRFSVRHIRIGTISGGIGVATVGHFNLNPYTAFIGGIILGILSIVCHIYLNPLIVGRLRVHDTLSIHASFGVPSVLSGLASGLFSVFADETSYGLSLYEMFPARAPVTNSSDLEEIKSILYRVKAGSGRSAGTQAVYQLYGLGFTLIVAIISGILTGIGLIQPIFDPPTRIELFQDGFYWALTGENDAAGSLCETETNPEEVTLSDLNSVLSGRTSRKVSRCSATAGTSGEIR